MRIRIVRATAMKTDGMILVHTREGNLDSRRRLFYETLDSGSPHGAALAASFPAYPAVKTVVLIHGAFADGSERKSVTDILQSHGWPPFGAAFAWTHYRS
jgi:hypothetical protein